MQLQEETLPKKFRLSGNRNLTSVILLHRSNQNTSSADQIWIFRTCTDSTSDVMQGQGLDAFCYASEKIISSFCNFRNRY